jgi:hypothetical protein
MTHPDDPRHRDLYIVARVALDNVGLNGYDLCVGIDMNADRVFFLCCRPLLGFAPVLPAHHVAHEQAGPLPLLYLDRIINQPKGNQPE